MMRHRDDSIVGDAIAIDQRANAVERSHEQIVVRDYFAELVGVIDLPIEYVDDVALPVQMLAQIVINASMRPFRISIDQYLGGFWFRICPSSMDRMNDVALDPLLIEVRSSGIPDPLHRRSLGRRYTRLRKPGTVPRCCTPAESGLDRRESRTGTGHQP